MDVEVDFDKYLRIKTNGRDDSKSNYLNFPYEPTPYQVIERLANSGYITKRDKIIDYGCGKGRVDFYLGFQTKAKMIGIEYDERLYNVAKKNQETAISANKVNFININALDYELEQNVTGAYLFNPFSTKILKVVIEKILKYVLLNQIEFKLFFYYPSNSYLELLKEYENLVSCEKIECYDLFKEHDTKEYILICKIK